MKKLSKILMNCSLVFATPFVANAAGTYYTGGYQSPQANYSQQSYSQRTRTSNYSDSGMSAYNRNQYANSGYTMNRNNTSARPQGRTQQQKKAPTPSNTSDRLGFYLDAGISHQTSMWQFEMKNSGSILHYDNIDWNVFDINAGYVFNVGNTPMQVMAGFKYGMQSGDSTMIDDDISNGGYFITEWVIDEDEDGVVDGSLGDQLGHALSIGTAQDGSMMEFNGGFGLTDFIKWGKVKITPSIGWRYLKYELETHNNHGLAVDTFSGSGGCINEGGETQCDPVLIFYDAAGRQLLVTREDTNGDGSISIDDEIRIPSGYEFVDTGNTYYYDQQNISHKYEVEWSGPYIALDMLYDININNKVNAHIELGLPSYTATGDQPYRFDWEHPKSVEDKAGIGDAFHIGMGANWSTAITNSVALSIGVTYDYYTVSGADATTYLNEDYYMGAYNALLSQWESNGLTEEDMLNPETGDPIALNIVALEEECPGWVCKDSGEIDSFFKSLGVRIGINAKF